MRRFWGESISWPKNNIAEVTTEASILPYIYLSWWNFTPQFLSFKSVCYLKKIKGNVSHYHKNYVSAHLSLFEERKLEEGNPKSNTHTHTHTLPIPLFPEPFPSSIQPPQRNGRSASSASSDDVHEEMKVSQPFWSKHPSIKLKAGLPRWVCRFYSAHIHIADTHIRSFLTHPDSEKCLSFQSGCKKKEKKANLPSYFVAF